MLCCVVSVQCSVVEDIRIDFFMLCIAVDDIKSHPFFKDINWDTLLEKPGVFVPTTSDVLDTGYFWGTYIYSLSLSHN